MAVVLPVPYFEYIKNVFYIMVFYKIIPSSSGEYSYYILSKIKWSSFLWEFNIVEEVYKLLKMGAKTIFLSFLCF